MPGAYPAINHSRTATNATSTQMFHVSPQRQYIFQGMNERASYTAQQTSFRECFLLQKYSLLLPLHYTLFQHTSPLLNNSGLPWGNILCSTVSPIPLLSCSTPWFEIQKEAKSICTCQGNLCWLTNKGEIRKAALMCLQLEWKITTLYKL